MRILHFADLHIGVENYGRPDPETGLSTRLNDFLAAYDAIVDYALDTSVDLVLFCGDAYKSRDPSQTHQREFAKRIARLSSRGVPVFLLVGNHDLPHVLGRATALEIFQTLDVANVHIGNALKTYRIETASGPVQIVGVPWVTRSSLLARDETRRLTPDEVNMAMQERLARLIRAQAEGLDPGIPAVLAGHLSVGDAKAGSEQWMMLGRDYVLLKSDVALPQFDYVALGHVHRHQILARDPYVVYSGSVQRVDFGEEDDEKGFCEVDLDTEKAAGARLRSFEFQRLDARRFLTIRVRVGADELDATAAAALAISKHDVRDAIVRVQIELPSGLEGGLRDGAVRDALEDAHHVASISREIIDQPRTRLGSATSSEILDPKRMLRLYMDAKGIPEDKAAVLMRPGGGVDGRGSALNPGRPRGIGRDRGAVAPAPDIGGIGWIL